ncbi:MAG: hypothetical protein ACOC44_20560, partial [Promethearchaeia archaeon]
MEDQSLKKKKKFYLLILIGMTCVNMIVISNILFINIERAKEVEVKLSVEVQGNKEYNFNLPPESPALITVGAYENSPEQIEMIIVSSELGLNISKQAIKERGSDYFFYEDKYYTYKNNSIEFENSHNKEISYQLVLRTKETGKYEVKIIHND